MSKSFKHFCIENFIFSNENNIIDNFVEKIKNRTDFLPDRNEYLFEDYGKSNTGFTIRLDVDVIISSYDAIELIGDKMSNILPEFYDYYNLKMVNPT